MELAKGLRRVLAPNPSPMTFKGTNTYLLGEKNLVIIDPGPDMPAHRQAIKEAIGSAQVRMIFVTHSHLDHSPLAAQLGSETGAPVLAFGDSLSGRSAVMSELAAAGFAGGGEGVDPFFQPDRKVGDGEFFVNSEWQLEVIHTPGHMGNHICLKWGRAIFSGDLVMGWASSLVSPPDGDLSDFMASCERLRARAPKVLYPGHGAPVANPVERIEWLMSHRQDRTAALMSALSNESQDLSELTKIVYAGTPTELHAAASRNLFAHLVDLHRHGHVVATPRLAVDAVFSAASR